MVSPNGQGCGIDPSSAAPLGERLSTGSARAGAGCARAHHPWFSGIVREAASCHPRRRARTSRVTSPTVDGRDTARTSPAFAGLTLVFTVLLGISTLLAAVLTEGAGIAARIATFVFAVALAITAFSKARHEADERKKLTVEAKSLAEELAAERQRNLTSVNGALLQSVLLVQSLAAMTQTERQLKVSEARSQIVQSALDLVKCPNPRACYFKIVDGPGPSTMAADTHRARDRTDEPTTTFREGMTLTRTSGPSWITPGPCSLTTPRLRRSTVCCGASRVSTERSSQSGSAPAECRSAC